MSKDEIQQNALADVLTAAARLHQLRALTREVESLLNGAMTAAVHTGLTKTVVSEAAGITRGRVSQIVSTTTTATYTSTRKRLREIDQWPDDALRSHQGGFAGRMSFPPYARRRQSS